MQCFRLAKRMPVSPASIDEELNAMTSSVLSYFKSYFNPGSHARFANHSTGQIASHLYTILREHGSVLYLGSKERPQGLHADLFIGHFWAFAELCRSNSFQ